MSKELKPVDQLKQSLKLMEPQFKAALPSHIPIDRFIRVMQTAIGNNPELANLDRNSFYSACMRAAQDGLLPDGKEAALVKFKDKVAYLPMVGGILKLIRNSGELLSITSQIIYANDKFRYWVNSDGEHLEHEPNLFSDRGKIIGVYALAKTKDGGVYIEPMSIDQVNAVKNASRSKDFGPWSGPFETEMMRKTAIKRLAKRLPMSTDIEGVLKGEEDMVDVTPPPQVTEEEPKQVKKTSRLGKIIEIGSEVVSDIPSEVI